MSGSALRAHPGTTRWQGCAKPHSGRPHRTPVVRAGSGSSGWKDPETREAVKRLSRLFYEDIASPAGSADAAASPAASMAQEQPAAAAAVAPELPGVFKSLPIWRTDWAAMPGSQAVLHVHAPHIVYLFDALFATASSSASSASTSDAQPSGASASGGSRSGNGSGAHASEEQDSLLASLSPMPIRFGHLYTPRAATAASAAAPDSTQKPGSGGVRSQAAGGVEQGSRGSAASGSKSNRGGSGQDGQAAEQQGQVGCLMEVTRAVRLEDGKLLMLATVLGRFQVLRMVRELPYPTADVAVLPDAEEVEAVQGLGLASALQAAEDATARSASASASPMIEGVMGAARAAAHAAAAASGLSWHAYEFAVPRMAAWWPAAPVEPIGDARGAVLAVVDSGVVDAIALPGGPVAGRWPGLVPVAAQAEAQAAGSARAAAAHHLQAAGPSPFAYTPAPLKAPSAPPSTPLPQLHQDQPEGMQGSGTAEAGAESDASALPAAPAEAGDMTLEQLELLVWQELDALAAAALRAQRRALSLPLGLLQLRPPLTPQPQGQQQAGAQQQQQQQASSQAKERQQMEQRPPAHWGAASEGLDVCADPAWPLVRRAQRLSFALAAVFTDPAVPTARQALLELPSIRARLHAALATLQAMRARMGALALVREIEAQGTPRGKARGGGTSSGGSSGTSGGGGGSGSGSGGSG